MDHAERITNTDTPIIVKSGEHLGHVRQVMPVVRGTTSPVTAPTANVGPTPCKPFSKHEILDPDCCLYPAIRDKFRTLHQEFDNVFNPAISKYDGASGHIEAVVDIGPTLPPQRKGRLPQYNRSTLEELQDEFDELNVIS